MPFQEHQSKRITISYPNGEVLAVVNADEQSTTLVLTFNQRALINAAKAAKTPFRSGEIRLTPFYAKCIGEGLMRAAELADKAWADQPPTDPNQQ